MNTTDIAKMIALLHFTADNAQLADDDILENEVPIAMLCGMWDLEADLIDIDSKCVVEDLDERALRKEICEYYKLLVQSQR